MHRMRVMSWILRCGTPAIVVLGATALIAPALSAEPDPTAEASPDQVRRVRELLYVLRWYRIDSREAEWVGAIRELVEIGRPAVPEIAAEFDRAERDETLRALAFTLRAIGDPRAMPALIRAIPKALCEPRSDMGMTFFDPELHAFMKKHERVKRTHPSVAYGRVVNEIFDTLESLVDRRGPTAALNPDPLRRVLLADAMGERQEQRRIYDERRSQWQGWWDEHRREFVAGPDLPAANVRSGEADVVKSAGEARFGPLFPTGAGVRLGPVRETALESIAYWDGLSHLDFDTGSMYQFLEGTRPDAGEANNKSGHWRRSKKWFKDRGVDFACSGAAYAIDLLSWKIASNRWDTLEAEIQSGNPIALGEEAEQSLDRLNRMQRQDPVDDVDTFLFVTREGGRGIVQVDPQDEQSDGRRLRYRMFVVGDARVPDPPAAASPRRKGTPLAEAIILGVDAPGRETRFLLDLDSGRRYGVPEFVAPESITQEHELDKNKKFVEWCQGQGIDLIARTTRVESREHPGEKAPDRMRRVGMLLGLELTAIRVDPKAFDSLMIEEVRDILSRTARRPGVVDWLVPHPFLAGRPDTLAIETREGHVGLLQFESRGEGGKLIVRYRLERENNAR